MLNQQYFPMIQAVLENIEHLLVHWQKDELHYRLLQRALGKLHHDFLSDKVIPALVAPTMAWRALKGEDHPVLYALNTSHYLFYAFLDLTDDAEDHELEPALWQSLGTPMAVNTGTSLLFLALLSLDSISHFPAYTNKIDTLRTLFIQSGWYLTVGQHRDLSSARYPLLSPQEVIKTHRLKTGSSVKLYLESAAILANAPPKQQAVFAKLGENIGIMTQILGDWHNLQQAFSSDLANHCQSLPLAFLRPELKGSDQEIFQAAYQQSPSDQAAHKIIRHLLKKYAVSSTINTLLKQYSEQAHDNILQLKDLQADTQELEAFLQRYLPIQDSK